MAGTEEQLISSIAEIQQKLDRLIGEVSKMHSNVIELDNKIVATCNNCGGQEFYIICDKNAPTLNFDDISGFECTNPDCQTLCSFGDD